MVTLILFIMRKKSLYEEPEVMLIVLKTETSFLASGDSKKSVIVEIEGLTDSNGEWEEQ